MLLIFLFLLIGFMLGYGLYAFRVADFACISKTDFEEVMRIYETGKLLGW